jgi:hypothetical protein
MGLNFAKKTAPKPVEDEAPAPKAKSAAPKGNGMGFMKKGAAAKEAYQHEEAKAEAAKAEQGKLWRFWMPDDGEDRKITFLDGDVDSDGMLDIPMFYEHTIKLNGEFKQFVCTEKNGDDNAEPCPICAKNEKEFNPALVGVMTVIDHTPHKIKSGPNAGKVIKNTRKLFVAKKNSIKLLTKLAIKRGGLAGCTFDVSRSGDKSPGVGNQFDFVEKFDDLSSIMEQYGLKEEEVMPANYEDEIPYRTADELVALGAGKAFGGIGMEKGVSEGSKKALKDEL